MAAFAPALAKDRTRLPVRYRDRRAHVHSRDVIRPGRSGFVLTGRIELS